MALNLFRIKEFASESNFEIADLHMAPDGKHFLFIYKIENKFFAQYDDKIYDGFDAIEKVIFKKGGKIFIYKYSSFIKKLGIIKDENQDFINVNGKIFGAFTKVIDIFFNDNMTFFIWYENFGKTFVVINNEKFGPYRTVNKVFLSPEGTGYAIQYKDGSLIFIKTEDEIFGGFEDVKNFHIDNKNNYTGYIYKKPGGEYFVKINSNIMGPFQNCSELEYHADINAYYFFYTQDNVNFIRVNNYVIGGYEKYSIIMINKIFALVACTKEKTTEYQMVVNYIGLYSNILEYALGEDNESYIFAYTKMGQVNVVANGIEYGPYRKVSNLCISKNGTNYCFVFEKQYENNYVNVNGDLFGPYPYVSEAKIGNLNSNFGFIYQKNAKWFVNVSNAIHGMYEGAANLVLSDNGSGFSYKFTKRHKSGPFFAKLETYLSINGEITEKNIELFDYIINTTGIEATVYKYNQAMYVDLCGTELGPYQSLSQYKFLQDDSLFAFRFKMNPNDPEHLQINGRQFFSQNKTNQIYTPIFSNDKKRYAFIHFNQNGQLVQINDETYGPYELAHFPSFSPDDKIFIFKYMNNKMEFLNINGMKLGPFYKAQYAFSDGKLYICYLQDNMIFIDEITW
ncbi:MAG: hypothetical protein A2Y39_04965 [Candidatus Delongbacteria bacterium GWF2_40_14]|nr:MAG: hypothetical protein A2Y39_04965 [Candidatus Delongbacteria bacterium GWF2_40_14]